MEWDLLLGTGSMRVITICVWVATGVLFLWKVFGFVWDVSAEPDGHVSDDVAVKVERKKKKQLWEEDDAGEVDAIEGAVQSPAWRPAEEAPHAESEVVRSTPAQERVGIHQFEPKNEAGGTYEK